MANDTQGAKTAQAPMLEDIADLCRRGFRVTAIAKRGKVPLEKGWRDAVSDFDVVVEDFIGENFGANVGIVLGGDSRIFAVDIDGQKGMDYLKQNGWKLPPTLTTKTGRDKEGDPHRHYFYIWPEDCDVRIPSSHSMGETYKDAEGKKHRRLFGVDLKGDGGYVVAPPSVHENGNVYEWVDRRVKIAPAPHWVIEWMRENSSPRAYEAEQTIATPRIERHDEDRLMKWAKVTAQHLADEVATAPPGSRHTTLIARASSMGRLVHILGHFECRYILNDAIKKWGDRKGDARIDVKTIEDGLRLGARQPKFPPERALADAVLTYSDEEVRQLIEATSGGLMQAAAAIEEVVEIPEETLSESRKRVLEEVEAEVLEASVVTDQIAAIGPGAAALVKCLSATRIKQPNFIAIAIGAIGAIWAGKQWHTATGHLAASVLLAIGQSGTGKGSSFHAVHELVLDDKQWSPATFPSVQAVMLHLELCSSSQMASVFGGEELGKNLSELFAWNAAPSKREVASAMLELVPMGYRKPFSRQASISGGGGAVKTVIAPCTVVIGGTTEVSLRTMLSGDSAEDGLNARLVCLPGITRRNPYAEGDFDVKLTPDVIKLRSRAKKSLGQWQRSINPGRLTPEPMPVEYDHGVADMLSTIYVDSVWASNDLTGAARALAVRTCEKVERLALALAVANDPSLPIVNVACVTAAHTIVQRCHAYLAPKQDEAKAEEEVRAHGSHDARAQASVRRALRARVGWVPLNILTRATQALSFRERERAIEELRKGGSVAVREVLTGGRKRTEIALR